MTTIHDLKAWKADGRRFTMLTAYDFPTAQILDRAGVPLLLVGDSVGNNVLGYEDTLPVTMEEMLHHTRAVARGAERAMVIGDLPFLSYQVSIEEGVRNAGRLVKEGGAHAVKLEGPHLDLVHRLVDIGIPVMAHIGLTPQSVHAMGGYRVQGRGEAAHRVADEAEQLEKAGAFAIVLEGMPAELAGEIDRIAGDPHDRDRGGSVLRRAGTRDPRPPGDEREGAEARQEVRRRSRGDDRCRGGVHARGRRGHLPRRGPFLFIGVPFVGVHP